MNRYCPRCGSDSLSFTTRMRASVANPVACARCSAPLAPVSWPSDVLTVLGMFVIVPGAVLGALAIESWWLLVAGVFVALLGPLAMSGAMPLRVVRHGQKLRARIVGWALLVPALVFGFACLALVAYGLLKGAL